MKIIRSLALITALGVHTHTANATLIAQNKNFSLVNETGKSVALSEDFIKQIQDQYQYLNKSPFFDTKKIKNNKWVKKEFTKLGGRELRAPTADGRSVPCSYFNRGKKDLIIIAAGFCTEKERLAPLLEICSDYDIVLVHYWSISRNNGRSFAERFKREASDIQAVLALVNNPKYMRPYEQYIGLAKCYSTLTFTQVQATAEEQNKRCFDKLILDSCWLSLHTLAAKIVADPFLSFNFSHGGAPRWLKWITKQPTVKKMLMGSSEGICSLDSKEFSILNHISKIKQCPILFIQESGDLFCNAEEFQTIWDATHCDAAQTKKYAFLTPFEHSMCHIKGKELYKFACDSFITNNLSPFF